MLGNESIKTKMETKTITGSVGGVGCYFKFARNNTGYLELPKELKEEVKDGAMEYWIEYNYKFKEQWLDCDKEEDVFGIQGGFIYEGKNHLN